MNYKLQLLQKEWELEHIREKKTLALQNMKYEKAARLRDVEKQVEQSVLEAVKSLENYFNHTVMTDENYHELEEISKIIYYYGQDKNPLLISKFEEKKVLLYLDDLRSAPEKFVLVKNYEEFTAFILQNGLPDFISFDHDLGLEESGFDCAKWLVNYCLDYQKKLPEFVVHSQNPVGKENIESLLNHFKKTQNDY